jgi:hypothetical protein
MFEPLPPPIASYMLSEAKNGNYKRVHILFSKNFIMEQLIGEALPNAKLYGHDRHLYSMVLGDTFAGVKTKATLRPEVLESYPYIAAQEGILEDAAKAIFFSDVALNLVKQGTAYYANLLKDSIANQEEYFKKILTKVSKVALTLKGRYTFSSGDLSDALTSIEAGDLVYYDYYLVDSFFDKKCEALSTIYNHEDLVRESFNEDVRMEHLTYIESVGAICFIRLANNDSFKLPPTFSEALRSFYRHNAAHYIYSNKASINTFIGRYKPLREEIKHYPLITEADIITNKSKVEIVEVRSAIANHYRMLWVKKADMADAGTAYLMFVDGKLIGLVQLATALIYGSDLVSIFTDPACPHSRYKRLSKLVLALCCTEYMLKVYNTKVMWEHRGFTTKVTTNGESSMKYRGLFESVKKELNKYGDYKYSIVYQNRSKIFKTSKEALCYWLDKDSKIIGLGNRAVEETE